MKQEYIPGDLVMTAPKYNCQYPKGLICEFVGYELSHKEECIIKVKGTDEKFWLGKENIVPINLISEILKKNGWKSNDMMPYPTYSKGKTSEYVLTFDKDNWRFKYDGRFLPVEIKYIHQLQHLLFGLGFNSEMKV